MAYDLDKMRKAVEQKQQAAAKAKAPSGARLAPPSHAAAQRDPVIDELVAILERLAAEDKAAKQVEEQTKRQTPRRTND